MLLACEICRIDVRCERDNSLDGNRHDSGAKYSTVLLSKSRVPVMCRRCVMYCNILYRKGSPQRL